MRNWVLLLICFFVNLCIQRQLTAHLIESNNVCCDSIFNGLYVGGNAGFVNLQTSTYDADNILNSSATTKARDTGWAAGFQLGYDWICHKRLLGLVFDWNWTNARTRSRFLRGDPGNIDIFHRARLHWFSTFRARAGLSLCDVLFYMTIGGALADIDHHFRNFQPSIRLEESFAKKYWGWTAGLGTEFALWCRWSLSAEVLYLSFQHKKYTLYRTVTTTGLREAGVINFYPTAWVGRLSLNYHFSFGNFCQGW